MTSLKAPGIPVLSKLPSYTGRSTTRNATCTITEPTLHPPTKHYIEDAGGEKDAISVPGRSTRVKSVKSNAAVSKPTILVKKKRVSMAQKMTRGSQKSRVASNKGVVAPKPSPKKPPKRVPLGTKNVPNTLPTKTDANLQAKAPKRAPWDIKGKLQDSEEKNKKLITDIRDLKSQLEQLVEESSSAIDDRDNAIDERDNAIKENEMKMEKIISLELELESTRSQLRAFEKEVPVMKAKIIELEESLDSKTCKLKSLNEKYSQLTKANATLNESLESLMEKKQGLETDVEELKLKCAVMNKDLQKQEILRRKLHNTILELKGNIRVFCRVRPFISSELESDDTEHIQFIDENVIQVIKSNDAENKKALLEFSLDRVFKPSVQQDEIFDEISELVQSVLDGYNVCIFAYGQTGSGKTFTMEGPASIQDFNVDSNNTMLGVIPRAVQQVFSVVENLKLKGWLYKIEISVVEIYNEVINDLLQTKSDQPNNSCHQSSNTSIKLNETKDGNTMLSNLVVYTVHSARDVYKLLKQARRKRATAATVNNDHSSRSHSVFMLHIIGNNLMTGESCEGTLNLVDLAGSEKYESNNEVDRKKETININKSLSNLGNVIMALSQKADHVPYRNSKLTHLLKNSLGGNSKTLMFVNISPRLDCITESINSLRFATKVNSCNIGTAKKVKS